MEAEDTCAGASKFKQVSQSTRHGHTAEKVVTALCLCGQQTNHVSARHSKKLPSASLLCTGSSRSLASRTAPRLLPDTCMGGTKA